MTEAPKFADRSVSPATVAPPDTPFRVPTAPRNSAMLSVSDNLTPQTKPRQPSIVDILSTPPPLAAEFAAARGRTNSAVSDSSLATDNSDSLRGNRNYAFFASDTKTSDTCDSARTARANSCSSASSSPASPADSAVHWPSLPLSELVQEEKLVIIDGDLPVEKAYDVLCDHNLTAVPVRLSPNDPPQEYVTFDYANLNAYLLLVLGKLQDWLAHPGRPAECNSGSSTPPGPPQRPPSLTVGTRISPLTASVHHQPFLKKLEALDSHTIPVSYAVQLGQQTRLRVLPETTTLETAVETLGSGVHRLAITRGNPPKTIGILSQRRLVRFFWENARRFPALAPLLPLTLVELSLGSYDNLVHISGDRPLLEALLIMHKRSVSSLAVTDSQLNLLGNISVVDVRLLTKSQAHLVKSTCRQFVAKVLEARGLQDGRDTYPAFHVYRTSTLSRVLAKLVATNSHRLWIVEEPQFVAEGSKRGSVAGLGGAAEAGVVGIAGKLVGVVSLTDVLSLLARTAGKDADPQMARRERRASVAEL